MTRNTQRATRNAFYNAPMQAGDRIGAYTLAEKVGAGGMGVVWRAHDARLGRDVALKILPPNLAAHPDALMRFEREARGLAALSHPNIVSIFDLGQEGDVNFIVTELLSGRTLREILRDGPMPWTRAAEIGATIADGLAAAHAKGIVHRDLKPENIFITSEGRLKILDFGLAKELGMSAEATTQQYQTAPGAIMGTLGYVSPEQLRGHEADFASDIFSLGCILYEMLSGRSAFLRGSAADTIAAILTAEPSPAGTSQSSIPPDLLRIVYNCLTKDQRARSQSAKELAHELTRVIQSEAIAQPSIVPSSSERSRWPRRIAIGVAAVLAIATMAGLLISNRRVPTPAGTSSGKPMSLVIMPFSAAPEQAYAGEGVADTVFRSLAGDKSLDVRWQKVIVPRDELLRTTGAGHALRGSLRIDGTSSVVDAEIIDLRNGTQVWNQRYTAAADDLLSLEGRLTTNVEEFVRRSTGQAGALSEHRVTTSVPEAYREYLRGRHYWQKFTLPGFATALAHFERSIDLDPTYALAYSGLADTYTLLGFHGDRPAEVMPKALAAAQRAIDLDPLMGEGYTSLGIALIIYNWRWREAEVALRRGVELNPRYASAHHAYGVYLGLVGRLDEALREMAKANELDPLALAIYLDKAWTHYARNEVQLAIETAQKGVRHDPQSPLARYELAFYFDRVGRYAEAIDAFESALRLEKKDTVPLAALREALQEGGERAYLQKHLELAIAAGEPHTARAGILVQLGEKDRALDALERAYEERERDMLYLKITPTYAPLRSDPRFQALVRKMGFPQV